jgi:hypothetical protein
MCQIQPPLYIFQRFTLGCVRRFSRIFGGFSAKTVQKKAGENPAFSTVAVRAHAIQQLAIIEV